MTKDFLGYELEDWWPTPPQVGPPLPRFLGILWPWYKPTPPPEGFPCPYCEAPFATWDELVGHIQSEHPDERIPIEIIWE